MGYKNGCKGQYGVIFGTTARGTLPKGTHVFPLKQKNLHWHLYDKIIISQKVYSSSHNHVEWKIGVSPILVNFHYK